MKNVFTVWSLQSFFIPAASSGVMFWRTNVRKKEKRKMDLKKFEQYLIKHRRLRNKRIQDLRMVRVNFHPHLFSSHSNQKRTHGQNDIHVNEFLVRNSILFRETLVVEDSHLLCQPVKKFQLQRNSKKISSDLRNLKYHLR